MIKVHVTYKKIIFILTAVWFLVGCATSPPKNPSNICKIFHEHRDWYDASAKMRDKWKVPIHIPMSIMYQESSFKHDAKPPMRWFLGIIPYGRASSAYGYSQAKTVTWNEYTNETNRFFASRDDFADAIDFIGWYLDKAHRVNKVSKWDGYNLYLNYHEGYGGYRRGTYKQKPWLLKVAKQVDHRAKTYASQLKTCEKDLQRGWFRRLFS